MRKRTKILLVTLFFLILLTSVGVYMLNKIKQELNVLTTESIPKIDLMQLEDGTYFGSYESLVIKVSVEVTIQNHVMTDIVILEHQNGQGDDAEMIIDDVILEQSMDIDLISGATYSSRAILLAISNALS